VSQEVLSESSVTDDNDGVVEGGREVVNLFNWHIKFVVDGVVEDHLLISKEMFEMGWARLKGSLLIQYNILCFDIYADMSTYTELIGRYNSREKSALSVQTYRNLISRKCSLISSVICFDSFMLLPQRFRQIKCLHLLFFSRTIADLSKLFLPMLRLCSRGHYFLIRISRPSKPISLWSILRENYRDSGFKGETIDPVLGLAFLHLLSCSPLN
jgi:hypothetical protein